MSNVRPVVFVNFTDQPFSGIPYAWPTGSENQIVDEHCKWDGVPDSFEPHITRYMEEWRAQHFAKHLINRELDKLGKQINDTKLRDEMLKKCILSEAEAVDSSKIEMELMNKNMGKTEVVSEIPKAEAEQANEKIKTSKKGKKKETEEFPDLKG